MVERNLLLLKHFCHYKRLLLVNLVDVSIPESRSNLKLCFAGNMINFENFDDTISKGEDGKYSI